MILEISKRLYETKILTISDWTHEGLSWELNKSLLFSLRRTAVCEGIYQWKIGK